MAEKEYIAKEFVIDAIEELKTKPMPKALLLDHLTKIIEIFPTEDFAPVRHGHWIECNYGLTFECSECKYPTEYNLTDYCPNCGAKMDGDKNG